MKKFLAAAFVLSVLISAVSAQEEKIEWQNDFKSAQAQARQTGRPLLLDFTAVWCGPCKAMEKNFWSLPDVARAMKPFVAVKIDVDHQKDLSARYAVRGIPFVVFADPLGNLITYRRGFGSNSNKEINSIFAEMPKDFSGVTKYYDAVDLKKDDGDALLKIADFYSNYRMFYLSCDFYKKAAKTDYVKTDHERRERVAATIGANYYASKADEQAIDYLADYLHDFPSGAHREVALAMIAISSANLDKPKDAAKYLDQLKKDFPASKNIEAVSKAIEEAKNKPAKK